MPGAWATSLFLSPGEGAQTRSPTPPRHSTPVPSPHPRLLAVEKPAFALDFVANGRSFPLDVGMFPLRSAGARKAGKKEGRDLFLVHRREEAVQTAVDMARKGDIVLLLGKGHEKSILSNGPQAAELRHIQQDDGDPRRVVKRDYDEVGATRQALIGRRASTGSKKG